MDLPTEMPVNKAMIILARESRGMAQKELADRIRMSPTNLSKIERGDIGISGETINAIADATSFPLPFFMSTGNIIPENLIYRKRQNVSQKLIVPIHAQANICRSHVQFLTRALNTPDPVSFAMPLTTNKTPADIATRLRRKWEVQEPVINNMIQLLEKNGIPVISFDFNTERIDSLTMLTDDRFPVIFVNKKLLGDRLRFSVAYELGKLMMHTFTAVPLDRDISGEANMFAAELLMPAKDIRKDFENGISIPLLATLKKKWKVSMIALLYRADDLGYLTPNQKRYLLQQFNTLNIRRREPMELDTKIEQPLLMKKWINAYRAKTKLNITEVAGVLFLHVNELIELYLQ